MTYDQLVLALDTALAPRVAAAGGRLHVAESLDEARAFLDAAPRRWRLILHWEGYGEHPAARQGMIFHQVATVIQAPRGLVANPSPVRPTPGGQPSFSNLITAVTAWMTALRFPDGTGADSAGFAPAGSQWLQTTAGFAAHAMSWKLDAALPPFDLTIPLVFPHLA